MIEPLYRLEFEASGIDVVRQRVRADVYAGKRLQQAIAWLEEQDFAAQTEASRLGLSAHRMGRIKIIFTDGSSQEFSATDQRQICDGEVLIRPDRIPTDLDLVWDNPPIYSRYVVVTCDLIQPGHYVRTATGLKRVMSVE